jgi:hypothetical protein
VTIQVTCGPVFLRRFHAWMTLTWALAIPISVLTDLKTSIAWVVLMSAWANFASHFSAWQSARVEVRQEEATPS